MDILSAEKKDLKEILNIQKQAFYEQGLIYNNFNIRPLTTTLEEIEANFDKFLYLKAVIDGKIVGSIRAFAEGKTCYIQNVIVDPYFQNKGIGKKMMQEIEKKFFKTNRFELWTGYKSIKNICFYEKLGYKIFKEIEATLKEPKLVFMEKVKSNISI